MTVAAIPAVAAAVPVGASALRLNAMPAVSGVVAAGSSQAAATQLLAPSETASIEASAPIAAPLPPAAPTMSAAAQTAAFRQGGLALLMADLSQALQIQGLPAPVQAASAQILALRVPLDAQPTAADIQVALTRSGPSPQAPLPSASGSSAATQAGVPLFPSSADIKGALLGLQQVLKSWLDGAQAQPLPSPASAIATPAATSRQDGSAPPEALPAATVAVASVISALPANVEFTGALQVFQQVFKSWFDPAAVGPMTTGAAGEAVGESLSGPPLAASATNTPPPPYRGGPTSAEPSVPSTLPLNANPIAVGDRLMLETSAALAHQELLEIASLPTATTAPASTTATPAPARNGGESPEWMVEIPFATPQGSAIAQLKISRDGGNGNTGRQATVWRARFSLDVEPMGPVHAQIALSGGRTWVSLWAERAEGVTRLRGHEALLTKALTEADFVAEIAIHVGAPHQPATSTGKFLNRES